MNPTDMGAFIALMAVIGVPVLGFTARFALKPIVDAIIRLREAFPPVTLAPAQEQRLAALEGEMHEVHTLLVRLVEKKEFDAQLSGGAAAEPPRLPRTDG